MGMERASLSRARAEATQQDRWSPPVSDIPDRCAPEEVAPVQQYAAQGLTWLMRTIENEIIPRLMLAHQAGPMIEDVCAEADATPGPHEVAELAKLALDHDATVSAAYVESIRVRGVALEVIYAELLAPTARRLGELWEADLCDFTQVTIGLWRLQQVMYDLSPLFQRDAQRSAVRRKGMLVPAPGSQHTLGVFMVAEYFRKAGWDIWGEPRTSVASLLDAVRKDWFDVIGFSVGAEHQIPELVSTIAAVRRASRNPSVGIMVGGPLLVAHPEFLPGIGADITAKNAAEAVEEAEDFIALLAKRC